MTTEHSEDELNPKRTAHAKEKSRSSVVLLLLLSAGFCSFKAKNLTQLRTKLFNLDLVQLPFCLFVFFKCKLEIKNYRNFYALP